MQKKEKEKKKRVIVTRQKENQPEELTSKLKNLGFHEGFILEGLVGLQEKKKGALF